MMTDASSSVTLKEIVDKYKAPSTHIYSSKYAVDKNVTLGKVEGSVQVYAQDFLACYDYLILLEL